MGFTEADRPGRPRWERDIRVRENHCRWPDRADFGIRAKRAKEAAEKDVEKKKNKGLLRACDKIKNKKKRES